MRRTALVLVFVLGWLAAGCDSQSSSAKLADGITASLWHIPGDTDEPWMLDKWSVSAGAGHDIYSAAHGYTVKVESDTGVGWAVASGVRVDAYVLESFDLFSSDRRYCIWDKTAPNGEYYGFVKGYPEGTATWDWGEQHATAITNANGCFSYWVR